MRGGVSGLRKKSFVEKRSFVIHVHVFTAFVQKRSNDMRCVRRAGCSLAGMLLAASPIMLLAASPSVGTEGDVYWHELELRAGSSVLVHGHSGCARAGRLLGVLGASGAGKTSLLNALAGVLPVSTEVTGAIWQAAGTSDGPGAWRRVGIAGGTAALLGQEEAFIPELTVLETLSFASQLEGVRAREATVEANALLQKVGLGGVAHRRVGERLVGIGAGGISGGERRRLAVACAIAGEGEPVGDAVGGVSVRTPRALFADEPTTGLDAFQAHAYMHTSIHAYKHTCIQAYIHAYKHTCI